MKYYILLFAEVLFAIQVSSQQQTDTTAKKNIAPAQQKKIEVPVDVPGKTNEAKPIAENKASPAPLSDAKKTCGCIPYVHKSRNWGRHGWLLVFSPLILFVLLMGGVLIRTRKFSLSDALTENVTAKKTIKNEHSSPEGLKSLIEATEQIKSTVKTTPVPPSTAPVTETTSIPSFGVLISSYAEMFPPTIVVSCDNDTFRPSSSRLLALISCLLVMAFVVGIACFYIYQYMYTGCPPDLSGMTGVLVTLGIGVVPYAGNKIGAAFKGKE